MNSTPKSKAIELVKKITDTLFDSGDTVTKPMIKRIAIMCADETIAVLDRLRKPEYTNFIEWEQLKNSDEADVLDGYQYKEYWQKVKKEIKKF